MFFSYVDVNVSFAFSLPINHGNLQTKRRPCKAEPEKLNQENDAEIVILHLGKAALLE